MEAGKRRRTPGLRREEVATLAGVSVVWYTWMEQGRDVNVSRDVLSAIARSLRLTGAERRHLFGLAGHMLPAGRSLEPPSPVLRALVEALDPDPAYVLSPSSDLIAWNRATEALLGEVGRLDAAERNTMWLLFTDPATRRMVIDWPRVAQRTLADYKLELTQHQDDPRFGALTAALFEASADFRRWWVADAAVDLASPRVQLEHPQMGRLALDYIKLIPNSAPDLRLVAAMPADDDTASKLRRAASLR